MTVLEEVKAELRRASLIHDAAFHSSNEAAGVIREEYLEAEHELYHGDPERARTELIQLAAMAVKGVEYIDKKIGRKTDG